MDLDDKDWVEQAEKNLWDLANGAEGEMEKLDKDGAVHNLHYKLPPNLDANKFILKNRSRGKWADKTEITSTQINVNLTASYDEVNKILAQQKQKQIECNDDVIDVEFSEVKDEKMD